jgi:hypothetical protein
MKDKYNNCPSLLNEGEHNWQFADYPTLTAKDGTIINNMECGDCGMTDPLTEDAIEEHGGILWYG